jgi:predicted RNA-binding protein with TRAM domain
MPLGLRWGTISAVGERHDGVVRLEVDGKPCLAYPRLTGEVEVGDVVLVNVQATELELGSGGFDVLYANLTRGLQLPAAERAHVMTLPYTPGQAAARFAEEERGERAERLEGMPVVCTGLHSQLAPVCAALGGRRVAYVQQGGGALPLSLSDTVRALKARKLLETAIAVSPCLDGDVQCVTVASALLHAAGRGADVVVCGIGPGIVGTGSRFGHGGLAVADAANAAAALGGAPIVAPRVSFGDERERHRGLSHHTRSAVELCLGEVRVAWPRGLERPDGLDVEEVDVTGWETACGSLPLSHMGRGPQDDPWFFAAAFAAGRLAAG